MSKQQTSAIEINHSYHPDNPNFTGRGWTKQIIVLVLTIHVEEWYLRCDSLTSLENIDDEKLSPEKRYLLLTIKLFNEKTGNLSVSKQIFFNHCEKEYKKMTVKNE